MPFVLAAMSWCRTLAKRWRFGGCSLLIGLAATQVARGERPRDPSQDLVRQSAASGGSERPSRDVMPRRLVAAAELREWDSLRKLIAQGADPNAAQPDGMTAMHWAAYWGRADVTRELIAAGANVSSANHYQIQPLWIACRYGQADVAQLLLTAGADAQAQVAGGETLLMTAARSGNAQIVQALIENGAPVNAQERKGQTALMWASAEGNVAAVDALIQAGADTETALKSGFTAFFFAARQGQTDVVRRLLAAGVDVNAMLQTERTGGRNPRHGMSALLLAVESGHFELALELVRAGADPNDQRSGYAPLHAVSWVRKTNRGDDPSGDPPPRGSGDVSSLQFVRELVQLGADTNLQLAAGKAAKAVLNPRGATPFLFAARTADSRLMELLLELGADPLQPNADGCTPLMAAAGVGVRAVGEEAGTEPEVLAAVERLLQLGADVNTVDDNRETAMHGAAYRNFPRVVALLAANGADPLQWNHKNVSGWTPRRIAEGYRPGSFKPSPETIAAIDAAMVSADASARE